MGFPSAADVVSNPGSLRELFGLTPAKIGDLAVDLAITYSAPREATVTERPVEKGFAVSDARYIKPQYITMECIFTDPDVSGGNVARQASNGTLRQSLTTSWREKRDRLYELFETQELLEVSTPEQDYENMVILEILPDRRASTANAFFCTVNLREIRQVSSAIGIVDPNSIPKKAREKESTGQKTAREKRRPPSQDQGRQQTTTATEKEKTTLAGIVDLF